MRSSSWVGANRTSTQQFNIAGPVARQVPAPPVNHRATGRDYAPPATAGRYGDEALANVERFYEKLERRIISLERYGDEAIDNCSRFYKNRSLQPVKSAPD